MSKDSLGDRMKSYENRFRYMLPRRAYTMIRIDGKSFHNYTKDCGKPFDIFLIAAMQQTTKFLCEQLNADIGYTQSDEISLVLTDFKNKDSEAYFDGNLQKINSIAASFATSKFNQLRMRQVDSFDIKLANFDSRVWSLNDPWDVYNSFLWRQQDATRNSVQMVARSLASHKECQNKNSDQLQELIFQKGQNYNDYPTFCKRGTFVYKNDDGYFIDDNCPILTQDKNWFFKKLPMIDMPERIVP